MEEAGKKEPGWRGEELLVQKDDEEQKHDLSKIQPVQTRCCGYD